MGQNCSKHMPFSDSPPHNCAFLARSGRNRSPRSSFTKFGTITRVRSNKSVTDIRGNSTSTATFGQQLHLLAARESQDNGAKAVPERVRGAGACRYRHQRFYIQLVSVSQLRYRCGGGLAAHTSLRDSFLGFLRQRRLGLASGKSITR